jgi:hypothetical protein
VNRVLKAVGVAPTTPAAGQDAGQSLGRTGGSNTADALVAAEARAMPNSAMLTSDLDDLWTLLTDQHSIEVQAV